MDCYRHKLFLITCCATLFLLNISGCAPKKNLVTQKLPTEIVTHEQIPKFNRISVCQGPAKLYYLEMVLNCVVRCFDANNDGNMLNPQNRGIDAYEYVAYLHLENKTGHVPDRQLLALLIDTDFDGYADYLYSARLRDDYSIENYEKKWIHSLNVSMQNFAPSILRLTDYNAKF
jgi:hypothetical protein